MKKYLLHKLNTLIWYDSPKLVVDYYSSMLFVWNDYAEQVSSYWACFKLQQNTFIDFLERKISLLQIFKNENILYGYLEDDYDTLIVDQEGFTFDICLPGNCSYLLPNERVKIRTAFFGKKNHIYIKIIEFDGKHSVINISLYGKPILDISLENYNKYIKRLLFDETLVLIYNWNTTSFVWEEKNIQQLKNKRETLLDYDFLFYKKDTTYELISKTDKVIITLEDIMKSFFNEI